MTETVLSKAKSGSILLFHNDLENTTNALPDILTKLRDDGYEFVTVNDLIYHEDYSINAEGRQIPIQKASLELSAENVDEVMAQYSEELSSLGFTEEQLNMAAAAIKGGAEIPAEVQEVISHLTNRIPDTVEAGTLITDEAEDVEDLTEETELPSIQGDKDRPIKK